MKTKLTKKQINDIINGIKIYDKKHYKKMNDGFSCIMDDDENMFCFTWSNGYIFIDVKNDYIGFGWSFENAINDGLDNDELDDVLDYCIGW